MYGFFGPRPLGIADGQADSRLPPMLVSLDTSSGVEANISGGDDGAHFIVASKCGVLHVEAHKEAIQTLRTQDIVVAAVLHGGTSL